MNEQASEVLSRVSFDAFEIVAQGVLDDASASPIGEPQFDEIITSHNDLRTIGIVMYPAMRCQGAWQNSGPRSPRS